jgi:hypothetical protein
MTESESSTPNISTSSPLLITVAWLVVLIPTIWGFSYTAQSAMKIFNRAPAASARPSSPAEH